MSPRFVRLCLAVLAAAAVVTLRGQSPAPAARAPAEDELVSLKLPDADIDTVLTSLEALTGRTVLRPAALQTATYNFKTPKPMPKSEVVLALETVLALNGIGVAPQGDKFLVVTQLTNTRNSAPEMITGSTFDQPPSGKTATKLFQLEFLRVNDLQPLLQGILNPQMLGFVPLITANAALVTDSVSNLQRLELLLRSLDKPVTAGMTPKFYPLTHAKAADVVTRLRSIFQGTLQQQLGTATSYNADDRTNQVILLSDPRQYPLFDSLIAKLDAANEPDIHNEVIYLKNAKAVDVVKVVSQLVSGQVASAQRANAQSLRPGQGNQQAAQPAAAPVAPQPAAAPVATQALGAVAGEGGANSNEFSALASAFNDDRSNSIVVTGTKQDIRLIRQVIEKLDVALPQVRIEVVIAEVTIDDNHTSGISALGLQVSGDKLVGFTGSTASTTITAGTLTGPTARTPSADRSTSPARSRSRPRRARATPRS
jgi:general secretion pathway protein D